MVDVEFCESRKESVVAILQVEITQYITFIFAEVSQEPHFFPY